VDWGQWYGRKMKGKNKLTTYLQFHFLVLKFSFTALEIVARFVISLLNIASSVSGVARL